MASLNLSQDDLKSLESTRQKLATLVANITSMRESILQSNPLPPPASLEASAFILQKNIESILEVTSANSELFQRVVVHPSTNFPGRLQEGILLQLLRKKLEPGVESSAVAAREAAVAAGIGPHSFVTANGAGGGGGGASGPGGGKRKQRRDGYEDSEDEDDDDDDEGYHGPESDEDEEADGPREPLGLGDVWFDSRVWLLNRVTQFVREEEPEVYTKVERAMGVENLRTGLKRSLEEEEEEDDDDDDDEDDDDDDDDEDEEGGSTSMQRQRQQQGPQQPQQPPRPPPLEPEIALWYMAHGDVNVARNIERLSQQRVGPAGVVQRR